MTVVIINIESCIWNDTTIKPSITMEFSPEFTQDNIQSVVHDMIESNRSIWAGDYVEMVVAQDGQEIDGISYYND